MRKRLLRVGIGLLIGLVGIQFVPVQRSNPAVESDVPMSSEVKAVISRACYDCHSNETVWPWYSRVAPVSWLIARDVRLGRSKLNFSNWEQYNERKMTRKLRETVSEVETGKMPPWSYVVIHAEASLSDYEKDLLIQWAKRW